MLRNKTKIWAGGGVAVVAAISALWMPGATDARVTLLGVAEPLPLLVIGSALTVGGLWGRSGSRS